MKNGRTRTIREKILVPVMKSGTKGYKYHCVSLSVNNMVDSRPIHRIVLESFVGFCPTNMEGCHKDGNRANNRLDNLRWDTHKNNFLDTDCKGENNGRRKGKMRILLMEGVAS
jgi:hypothetical protein